MTLNTSLEWQIWMDARGIHVPGDESRELVEHRILAGVKCLFAQRHHTSCIAEVCQGGAFQSDRVFDHQVDLQGCDISWIQGDSICDDNFFGFCMCPLLVAFPVLSLVVAACTKFVARFLDKDRA